MNAVLKLTVVALATFGARGAAAGTPIFEEYIDDAVKPTVVESIDGNNDGEFLSSHIGMVSSKGRFVLLKDVTLGVQSIPIWGNNMVSAPPSVTVDLNGHRIDASGYYCKYESGRGINCFCNLTLVDSAGGGGISGCQTTCSKGGTITFDLPSSSTVSSDTGFFNWDFYQTGRKGVITINGGRYDGVVHGSDGNGTTTLTGGYFKKSKNGTITSYDKTTTKYFDNGDGYWRVVDIGWEPTGVKVNGVELADGPGAGWTFADGVLTLSEARDYTLTGANAAGAVRVEVTANATVTLNGLTLTCDSASADLIRFVGADARLVLAGVNTVYAKNGFAALQVASGAKLTAGGSGELVGGRSGSFCGRGAFVCGTLDWTDGTLRDYYFRKSVSTDEKGAGIYVENGGTLSVTGGKFSGNAASYGAAIYCRGTVNVYGGVVSGNSGRHLYYEDTGSGNLYGAVGTDLADAEPVVGKSVVKVADTLYVVGEGVTTEDGALTGGTFTFNPTNAAYAAAGLTLAGNYEAVRQETVPVTYRVQPFASVVRPQEVAHTTVKVYTNEVEVAGGAGDGYMVVLGSEVTVVYTAEAGYVFAGGAATAEATFAADKPETVVPTDLLPAEPGALTGVRVNGVDALLGAGDGWTFTNGVLTLANARAYFLSGTNTSGAVRVEVTAAGASVTVSNLVLSTPASCASALAFASGATNRLFLVGTSRLENACKVSEYTGAGVAVDAGTVLEIDAADGLPSGGAALTARGGAYASGIGNRRGVDAGRIRILGGTVVAFGGPGAAGLGGGREAGCAGVEIVGGTVLPTAGDGSAAAVGLGAGGRCDAVCITGGSVLAAGGVSPAPADGETPVHCVTVNGGWADGAAPAFFGLPASYGTNDIVAADGKVCLWLPNGDYLFKAEAVAYRALVADADVTATPWEDGVRVNGERLSDFAGTGWTFDHTTATLVLDGAATNRFDLAGQALTNLNVRAAVGGFTLATDAMIVLDPTNAADLVSLASPDAVRTWRDQPVFVTDGKTLALGAGTWYIDPAGRYDASAYDCTVVADGIWRLDPKCVTVRPQAVAHTTFKVYTNEVDVTGSDAYVVSRDATVTVVYSVDDGYVFAGGATTAEATFVADVDCWQVPLEELPAEPSPLTGVTVNGSDAVVGSGEGWSFAGGVLSLVQPVPYLLSGTNTAGAVRVEVTAAGAQVTVSNLVLTTTADAASPLAFTGAGTSTLLVAGTNVLRDTFTSWAAGGSAGILVTEDATLVIDAAEGWTDETALLTASGGTHSAGIGGRNDVVAGTIRLAGATVTATGGEHGAGIGGGVAGGTGCVLVEVAGGFVTAYGGNRGPGLGASHYGTCRKVRVSGGVVRAVGGWNGAGIGAGEHGDCGEVEIVGGTVKATGVSGTSDDIGACNKSDWKGTVGEVRIRGGSVLASTVVPTPTDGSANVHCVTVPGGWADGTAVALTGLGDYGTNDVFAVDGKVCLWLPNGTYGFAAAGTGYVVRVEDAATTASVGVLTGVTADGTDVGFGSGAGWSFADGILSLTNAQAYALSGTNAAGSVRVEVTASASVTFDRLRLVCPRGEDVVTFGDGADDVRLTLVGTNAVYAQENAAALCLTNGAKVTVSGHGLLSGNGSDGWCRAACVNAGSAFVVDGGAVCGYASGDGVVRCLPDASLLVNGGAFTDNASAYLFVGDDASTVSVAGMVSDKDVSFWFVADGYELSSVDELYVIGQGVTSLDGKLAGGLYRFDPADPEYAAAGLALADNRWVVPQGTSPASYAVLPFETIVVPQTLANTTIKVFADGVEIAGEGGAYVVEGGAMVTVVYTADDGCVFADGSTTVAATFLADEDEMAVPEELLPAEPFVAGACVTWASGESVFTPTFAAAMAAIEDGATVRLLRDLADEPASHNSIGVSYSLVGDGHVLRLRPQGGRSAFAVVSNATVNLSDVVFDGHSATGTFAVVGRCGALTVSNCVVSGYTTTNRNVLACFNGRLEVMDSVFVGNDAGKGALLALASTEDAPEGYGCLVDGVVLTNNTCAAVVRSCNATVVPERHWIQAARTADNGGAPAVVLLDGASVVSADFMDGNLAVLGRQSALAFSDAAPDAFDLFVQNAVSREGSLIVRNLLDVPVDAARVNVLNSGYVAWGENGNVYLASETNFLYAAEKAKVGGQGQEWNVFRTFGEAYASQSQPSASTSVSLVHYRNVPTAADIAEQGDDLTVGVGTNLVLRTVLRETVDGTNTTWNGETAEVVTLTGMATVAGTLKLENVAVAGRIVLAGGVLDVGAAYSTNGTPVAVELTDVPASAEVPAIVSDAYTGEQLLPHFSLKGDDLVFVVNANGLSVVRIGEDDKVARVGQDGYGTFSAAVAAVGDGGLVEIIARSNATTGVHRDEVKFGENVLVEAGKSIRVKSIRATRADVITVDEDPAVPVTLALDGSTLTLGAGASMAFTNVAMKGTLALAGSGLLDLADFTGTLYVRPTRTGLVATNVTDLSKLRLGTAATGTFYAKGTGVWWRDGSFTATFVQTGNGVGRIEIDDYGVKSTVVVDTPVKTGRYDYPYVGPTDQTGTQTNLAFGVLWCQEDRENGSFVILPPTSLYADGGRYPQYLNADGRYVDFKRDESKDPICGTFTTDLPAGEKHENYQTPLTLYICNYGASGVKVAEFEIVATEEDAQEAIEDTYRENSETQSLVETVANALATTAEVILTIFCDCSKCYVAYNVISWADAIKGLCSTVWRASCGGYRHDGNYDSDYFTVSQFPDACQKCIRDGDDLCIIRSTAFPSCTLKEEKGHSTLKMEVAACMQTDVAALVGCVAGTVAGAVPGVSQLAGAVVGTAVSLVGGVIEDGVCSCVDEREPHGMVSQSSAPMLVVSTGFTLTVCGMDESKISDKKLPSPVFEVSGELVLSTDSGSGKPDNSFVADFKEFQSTRGVVRVKNGGRITVRNKVTANASKTPNFYVENGGLVIVEEGGKDSRIGISGQTGNGAVFSNTNKSGAWSGTAEQYAAVFSNDDGTPGVSLAIDAVSGNVYWALQRVYLTPGTEMPVYASLNEADAARAVAFVLRPNADVEGVIEADPYNGLFTVCVADAAGGKYTLRIDLSEATSNAVQSALDAALPSLVATAAEEAPTATVSTQAGLYYGIAGAAEVGDARGVIIPTAAWMLGTGNAAQVVPGTRPATDRSFYLLRADILPE